MKVYCRDCKWLKYIGNLADQYGAACEHPSNVETVTEDEWYAPGIIHQFYKKYPQQKNAGNRCKNYTSKMENTI